jgi:hypothetical protein
MTDPLELHGENHRVRFNDENMDTHEMTLKLQALKLKPLQIQFVVDVVPKPFLTGRRQLAAKQNLKPTTKAYLRLGEENSTDADKMVVLSFVASEIVNCGGHPVPRERVLVDVEETAKRLAPEISYIVASALDKIATAREGILQEAA